MWPSYKIVDLCVCRCKVKNLTEDLFEVLITITMTKVGGNNSQP